MGYMGKGSEVSWLRSVMEESSRKLSHNGTESGEVGVGYVAGNVTGEYLHPAWVR